MEGLLMRRYRRAQGGISLIEALVAMAVMAFGTLAVLGVQTSLRANADVSKQRNEAVRIAQAAMEAARGYGTAAIFDEIEAEGAVSVEVYEAANAAYTAETRVEDAHLYADDPALEEARPRRKTVSVIVQWTDRSGQVQSVSLQSAVDRVPPGLSASLVVPGDISAVRLPGGRNAGIPREASTSDDGTTSSFTPPGSSAAWVFDNLTGNITQSCVDEACTDLNARLLTGYVRFATTTSGGLAPTDGDAKAPPGTAVLVDVVYQQTSPSSLAGTDKACFERLDAGYVTYWCAVPLGSTGTNWAGRSTISTSSLSIATSMTETSASQVRICRYTTELGNLLVPSQMTNEEHPNTYNQVRTALTNQNFLVIKAGDGTTAFACPDGDDNVGDPYLSGRTYAHQPTP
jgi:Tfp pilus assembly protein PilV